MNIKLINPLQRSEYPLNKLFDLRQDVRSAYSFRKNGEYLSTPKNRHSAYYTDLKLDILEITEESVSEGTLVDFFHEDLKRTYQRVKIKALEYYVQQVFKEQSDNIDLINNNEGQVDKLISGFKDNEPQPKSWIATTNFKTPQWANYLKIPLNNELFKSFKCLLVSKSAYYRFGFKLLRTHGKLFGDGSIQSMDNNFVIHLGKNFQSEEIFITTYNNGIRFRPNLNTHLDNSHNGISIDLLIDTECFLVLILNGTEVFRKLINREILEQIYMLAWGD